MARTVPYRLSSIGALAALICLSQDVQPQIPNRPTIIDGGEVKETRTKPVTLERKNVGPIKASRASYSVLIVRTYPDDAAVRINGKPKGKAEGGLFKRELPIGRTYEVAVSAGPDYTEFRKAVLLRSTRGEYVEAALSSKYGEITVFPAKDQLRLLLDDQAVDAGNMTVDQSDNTVTIEKVAPGPHKVTYDVPGYVLNERTFNVSPGSEIDWKLIPEKAVSDIKVVTEPGTSVYIDGAARGTTAADGKLTASDIYFGTHELKAVKDGFNQYTQSVQLGKDPLEIAIKLTPIPTSAEFNEDFDTPNTDRWTTMPRGVSIRFDPQKDGKKNGRMDLKNVQALASPARTIYRDFYMDFDLWLVGAGGAAWAVRAKDPHNYYLFYLSGSDGRFYTYLVKDNKFDPNKADQAVSIPFNLKETGDKYHIHIEGSQDTIKQVITPASNGNEINLGFFKDPNNTFPYGGIGFRTVGNEEFLIDDLFVGPLKPK